MRCQLCIILIVYLETIRKIMMVSFCVRLHCLWEIYSRESIIIRLQMLSLKKNRRVCEYWDVVCNIIDCLVFTCLPNVSLLNSSRQRYCNRSTGMRFSMPAWNSLLTRTYDRRFPLSHKSRRRNKTIFNITENICNYYVNFVNI